MVKSQVTTRDNKFKNTKMYSKNVSYECFKDFVYELKKPFFRIQK